MPSMEGTVTKIGLFPLTEEQKNMTTKDGQQYNKDKTHRVALVVDDGEEGGGQWFSAGTWKCQNPDVPTWPRKIDGQWTDLREGAKVEFMYSVNDKGYKNIKLGSFEVIENGSGKASPFEDSSSDNSGGEYKKKDYSGVEIGHCLNAVLCLINHDSQKMKEADDIIEKAKKIHDITKELKESHKTNNPQMNDYDIGASVGHAVLNSCRFVNNIDQVQVVAQKILDNFVPEIEKYVKGIREEPDTDVDQSHNYEDENIPF